MEDQQVSSSEPFVIFQESPKDLLWWYIPRIGLLTAMLTACLVVSQMFVYAIWLLLAVYISFWQMIARTTKVCTLGEGKIRLYGLHRSRDLTARQMRAIRPAFPGYVWLEYDGGCTVLKGSLIYAYPRFAPLIDYVQHGNPDFTVKCAFLISDRPERGQEKV